MASVEGAVVAQVPEPNQYWEHIKSKDRAYFIGRDPDGRMVWQCEGDCIEVGNLDWDGWRHLPGCTGWEWEPEEFPQYYVGTSWVDNTAYVVRLDYTQSKGVAKSGTEFRYAWDDAAKSFVERGSLVRVTEAEAMARLDKPIPVPADQWPKYYVGNQWNDKDAYIRYDGPESSGVWVTWHGTEAVFAGYHYSLVAECVASGSWRQVTEAEAKARVTKAATVEETFPQWYILKNDENRSWVPDWTVKRTGEETSIRYARDEAGEIYATNEPWTGAPDCWERCCCDEAIERLGTETLPAVPAEPRRVPVKLWVTYRLNDEGGDWPVRATQADQTCQNWKEIKFDGNGAFIEVEQ